MISFKAQLQVRGSSVEGLFQQSKKANEGILKQSICRENTEISEVILVNNDLLGSGESLG